jgi:hypothetical protein
VDFQAVLRAAGETATTQENIQDWLDWMKKILDLSFSQRKKLLSIIFLFISISTAYIIKFCIHLLSIFCLLGLSFASLTRTVERLLYFKKYVLWSYYLNIQGELPYHRHVLAERTMEIVVL